MSTYVLLIHLPLCRAPHLQVAGSSDCLLLFPLAPWMGGSYLSSQHPMKHWLPKPAEQGPSDPAPVGWTALCLGLVLTHRLIRKGSQLKSTKNPLLNPLKALGANAHILFKPIVIPIPVSSRKLGREASVVSQYPNLNGMLFPHPHLQRRSRARRETVQASSKLAHWKNGSSYTSISRI